MARPIIYYFGFYSLFWPIQTGSKIIFWSSFKYFLQIPNSLPRKSLNTDSLITCKFHLKFLQNNCQEISSPSSSYFCFSLRLLCTVRDLYLFHFMTLVLQECGFFLVFNRGDTVSRRSPIEGVRPSPYTTLCS